MTRATWYEDALTLRRAIERAAEGALPDKKRCEALAKRAKHTMRYILSAPTRNEAAARVRSETAEWEREHGPITG